MTRTPHILGLLAFAAVAACKREETPQPPTSEQSAQLNDAEDMLNDLGNAEGSAGQPTP